MMRRPLRYAWNQFRYVPLLSVLTWSRARRFDKRSRALGSAIGFVMRWFPPARWRFDKQVLRVFPAMDRRARATLGQAMGRAMGQTLFEIYHCAEFQSRHDKFHADGPGLTALEAARDAGKGALIVSGHFGQWEAVRAVLKARGMETGAIYRRQPNPHYQRRLRAGIEAGGMPILETGRSGTKSLVRHLRAGGFMAILLDEKQAEGTALSFLGHPALTSLAAAELALKYDLPMVPAYGLRRPDGETFDVMFEAPIPHSDPVTMTQAFNDSLSARIMAHPDQWYWMLRRWDTPRR
ncbi:lysophospholipid acyltransferase family protein [Yoonia vestfoldensis]|uniref:lysophospholipid acyltransferase family protein n=1 Tax=Yoonia vestfoldensis TaxID=245188 RepID=UPI0003A3E7D1|nr:lysophospholipid acyltransferase family protein [Yoonia vestfoldensis]